MGLEARLLDSRNLLFEAGRRIIDQAADDKPLDLDEALGGFDITVQQRAVMHEFGQTLYTNVKPEVQEAEKHQEQIKPYRKKGFLYAQIAGNLIGLGITYALTRDAWLSIAGGVAGQVIAGTIELKRRPVSSHLAGIESRKLGELYGKWDVIQLREDTLDKLDEVGIRKFIRSVRIGDYVTVGYRTGFKLKQADEPIRGYVVRLTSKDIAIIPECPLENPKADFDPIHQMVSYNVITDVELKPRTGRSGVLNDVYAGAPVRVNYERGLISREQVSRDGYIEEVGPRLIRITKNNPMEGFDDGLRPSFTKKIPLKRINSLYVTR